MDYPNNVYSWNRYQGDEAQPHQDDTGLPTLFSNANLPTQNPNEFSDMELDYPYSPVLIEMGVGPAGTRPHANVPASPPPTAKAAQPEAPALWRTVVRSVFGGQIGMSSANNTATLANGGTLKADQ